MILQEVIIISLVLSFMLSLIYRVLTNPKKLKQNKESAKNHRELLKRAQKEGNKDKTNEIMGEMLKANNEVMKATMKPSMVSILIFFVAIGWFSSTYGPSLTVEENTFNFQGNDYLAGLSKDSVSLDLNNDGKLSSDETFANGDSFQFGGFSWEVSVGEESAIIHSFVAQTPFPVPLTTFSFPFIYVTNQLSWFWVYLLITLPTTFLFRKLLGAE